MRLSWWRAVIAIASAPRMYRTDVVARAGLGGFPTEARLRADPRNATLGGARRNGEARRHRLSVNFPPRFARALALASLSAHDPPDDRDGGLRYAER